MMSLVLQFTGLKCAPLSSSRFSKSHPHRNTQKLNHLQVVKSALSTSRAEAEEREKLRNMFWEASERCRLAPMEGVSFTLDDFEAALEKYDFNYEIGTKVMGTVFRTEGNGALIDITAKSSAYLPIHEACIHKIKHVREAGIFPGMREEFVIVDENENDDSLILSLRTIQYGIAWERCRQLLAEDIVMKGKVVSANKGGVVTEVEGLQGFVPFSQISSKLTAEELFGKELPLKIVEVDEEQSRLVLSNRKAVADSQAQLGIGAVVIGNVQSIKPYGAFIDIGGINGLLHVSQISHDRVSDIATILQPGDSLKVMILSHDRERGRVSLSTKKLEPTPGDMIRNPKLVFEKAEEMAQSFRQRIAQAEAMARADMLRFQPEKKNDRYYMRKCVDLARKAIGYTSPNPMVGCVIVRDGTVVGEGFHPKAGQPHAEVFALRNAKDLAENATAYVSLEPCNHYGRTPPCTEALVRSKVKRVVVGMVDPNPIVASKGVERLRDAGIEVTVGVEEELCNELNETYIHRMLTGNPFVALRYSVSVNGCLMDQLGDGVTASGGYFSKLLKEYDAVIFSPSSPVNKYSFLASQEPVANQPVQILVAKKMCPPIQTSAFGEEETSKLIIFSDNHGTVDPEISKTGIKNIVLEQISLRTMLEYCKGMGLCSVLIDLRGNFSVLEEILREGIEQNLVPKIIMEILPIWDDSEKHEIGMALPCLGRRQLEELVAWNTEICGKSIVIEGYL